jgi:hypothetical protein
MADPRTFVLIGNFTDNITPALEKINNSIGRLKGNLADLSKVTKPIQSDFKELASLSRDFNTSMKGQAGDIRQMTSALKAFRGELGRVNRAYRSGGSRMMRQAAAPPPPPPVPRAPRFTRAADYSRGGYSATVGGAVGASVFGNQAADLITGSIVKGFQIGVSIMERPFQYFANALGERIKDEMSDIKAAGGYFSIAKRQEQPFVKTFDQALEFTQKNNAVLAKLAASLPGSTQDYIEVSKRIGDSVARTVMQDKGAAVAYANELRRQFPTMYGGELKGAGVEAQRGAITTLLGELTKKTVLAGQGGRSGAGGAIGPYGLPGLTERMLSQEQVSMGQFQRYSAIFSDPMIMDALQREIPKINATAKNSIERFKALQKFYDDVLPPEMIEKYRRSVSGLQEAFNTAILGPETGLFGLGRKMKGLGRKINDFGQYVDELGNVVTDVNKAAQIDLSVFDILRDVLANTAQVLMPIVENITMLWDPLKAIGLSMKDARHYTAQFLKTFNQYREGLALYAKNLGKTMGDKLLETKDLRASFAAIANLFKQLGVFDTATFKDISSKILDPNANLGEILKGLLDKFLNSKAAFQVGEFIGTLVGTVLDQVARAMGFVTGMATGGPLAKGLMQGFNAAGGSAAFASIIQNTFSLLGNLLLTIVKAAPLQTAVLGALMLLPAAISGLISSAVTACSAKMQGMGAACGIGGPGGRGRGGRGGFFQTRRMAARQRLLAYRARETAGFGAELAGLGYNVAGRPGSKMLGSIGKLGKNVGRAIPGAALAGGAIDLATSVASGENFGKAAVGAFGTVLGGAAGSIFGPAGTVIGSIAGGMLADAASDFVIGSLDQNKAAVMQLEAARKQVDAASTSAVTKYGADFGAKLGGVEALNQAMGGGAGVQRYAEEQLRLGKITAEQAQNWGILSKQLTNVNTTTSKVEKAQKAYDTAVKLNTGQQEKYKKELEEAQRQQKAALGRITANWETMSTTNRSKLLEGADNIRAALDEAAAKIRGWKGLPGLTPAPPPRGPGAPPPTTDTSKDRRNAPAGLDSRKLIPGLPATPESGYGAATGRLGDAIAKEMRMKPPGSDLVIANSSETVIPAAGGYGMLDFVETLRSGFNTLVSVYKEAQAKQNDSLNKINATLLNNQQQTNARLSKLETKFTTPAMGGLGAGAAGGGVDSFTPIAQRYGLQMTSGYRPGDPGWHGANRARDFSNGTGSTPQMMQFAQYMASTYGANLKELIYTPLGFSIKNGQKVAPYAQSSHFNHVHVAYALGPESPTFFDTQAAAVQWERSMVPGSMKVASVTTNSGEMGGGDTVINGGIHVTVQGSGVDDADELAAIVAMKIGDAVEQARLASLFV